MGALLIPGLIFFGAVVLIGFAQTLTIVGRSQADADTGFRAAVLPWLTGEAWAKLFVKQMRAPVSRWAAAQLAPVARWLVALNSLVVAHSATTARMEDAIGDGFTRLRNVVIPRATGKAVAPVKAQAKTAQRSADHAASRAKTANTAVTHLGAEVRPKIKAHQHAIDVTLPGEIGRIRTRTKEIGKEIEHPNHGLLSRWAKWLWAAGLAGLVVRTLTKRFPTLFCRTFKSVSNKRGCSMWGGLDKLLGLFVDALVITNICRVLPWLETGFSTVAAPLISTLTTVGAGLCSPTSSPPELLPEPSLYLPDSISTALYLP